MIAYIIAILLGVSIGIVVSKATDWLIEDFFGIKEDSNEKQYKIHHTEESV